jgi:hypothetical protein
MNELKRLRSDMMYGNSNYINNDDGYGFEKGKAASALLDTSTYDALIHQKQREIINLVAESNESQNKNNHNNYSKLIQEKQGELNGLVKGKNLKELRMTILQV